MRDAVGEANADPTRGRGRNGDVHQILSWHLRPSELEERAEEPGVIVLLEVRQLRQRRDAHGAVDLRARDEERAIRGIQKTSGAPDDVGERRLQDVLDLLFGEQAIGQVLEVEAIRAAQAGPIVNDHPGESLAHVGVAVAAPLREARDPEVPVIDIVAVHRTEILRQRFSRLRLVRRQGRPIRAKNQLLPAAVALQAHAVAHGVDTAKALLAATLDVHGLQVEQPMGSGRRLSPLRQAMSGGPLHGPWALHRASKYSVHHVVDNVRIDAALGLREETSDHGVDAGLEGLPRAEDRVTEEEVAGGVRPPLLVQPHEDLVHLGVAVAHRSHGVVRVECRVLILRVGSVRRQRRPQQCRDVLVVEHLLQHRNDDLAGLPEVALCGLVRVRLRQSVADDIVVAGEDRDEAQHPRIYIPTEIARREALSADHQRRDACVELRIASLVLWDFVVVHVGEVGLVDNLHLASMERGVVGVAVPKPIEDRRLSVGIVTAIDDIAINPR
mmetsp:Transcript_49080/g.141097  ORF Transcript_49080/g.141097 Transcript_49080/m.141097 type:complete len:499 (-) Transcript_49080:103-1599(-)